MSRLAPTLLVILALVGPASALDPSPARAAWPSDPSVNVPVSAVAGAQRWPEAISDGQGGVFIVWEDGRNSATTGFDVYAQHLSFDGVPLWAPGGVPVCVANGDQLSRAFGRRCLVLDGQGGVILAWEDERSDDGDIYAQRLDADGNAAWTQSGVPVCTKGQPQFAPVVVSDGSGGAVVVWSDGRTFAAGIYGQRLNAAGVALWTADGRPLSTGNIEQVPSVIPDGSGGAVAAWECYPNLNDDAEVYVQHINGAGIRQRGGRGLPVGTGSGKQVAPTIIADGAGGAMVFWSDDRAVADDFDVYGQRIDALGSEQWTAGGVLFCAAPQWQYGPVAVLGTGGEAFVSWEDHRGTPSVFGQRVDGAGTAYWASSGQLLSTVGRGLTPALLSDGTGGALVGFTAWPDLEASSEIYAQRVDATGAALWNPAGVALCTAPGHQNPCVLVPGAAGGAIAVWEDPRSDAGDIYAQYVSASGVLGGAVSVPPSRPIVSVSLTVRSANPLRDGVSLGFELPRDASVSLALYDASGRRVRDLVRGWQDRGGHLVRWDGRGTSGEALVAGLYFAALEVDGQRLTARLALIR